MAPAGRLCGSHSSVRWDPAVEAYFRACFGPDRLAAISSALSRPSLTPSLRVNKLRARPEDVVEKLRSELRQQQQLLSQQRQLQQQCPSKSLSAVLPSASVTTRVQLHRSVPIAVMLYGTGPCDVSYDSDLPEVVVNRYAGEAVLKGANVYVPGVLAASQCISAGHLVNVSAALERPVGHSVADGAHGVGGRDMATRSSTSTKSARWAVGISRGALVQADGSVPLAWARQPLLKQRQQQPPGRSCKSVAVGSSSLSDGPVTATLQDSASDEGSCLTPGGDDVRGGRSSRVDNGSRKPCERDLGDGPADDEPEGCSSPSNSTSSSSCLSSDSSMRGRGGGGSTDSDNMAANGGCSSGSSSSSNANISTASDREFLGVARAALGRRAMFRAQEGLALQMEQRLYDIPPCNGLLRGDVMMQALPSIVAAQVLRPRPGARVLDMCAAPGGKTTLLAAIMGDQGRIIALDRTASKVGDIMSLAEDLGVSCVEAYQADATEAVVAATAAAAAGAAQTNDAATAASSAAAVPVPGAVSSTREATVGPPPYLPGSFDYVLLDPPCSALGLRPRLLHSWSLSQLQAMAAYQRSLLYTAVQLLAPGGEMVYCTCTVNPDENEANVAWAMDRFSGSLELLPAEPYLGLPGLTGTDPQSGARWMSEDEATMVQRFDPGWLLPGRRMASEVPCMDHDQHELLREVEGLVKGNREEPQVQHLAGEHQHQQRNDKGPLARQCGIRSNLEEEVGDDVMGFFIARFRKVL